MLLNSLDEVIGDINILRTARELISCSIPCGVKIVDTVEVPKYIKITYTKFYIKVSLDKLEREYGLQPELLKGEINHSKLIKYINIEWRHIWEPYFESDIFCLAVIYARHALEMQKKPKTGVKGALTEASLGWRSFGLFNKDRDFLTFKN